MAQAKEDFWSRYSKMCLQEKMYPSKSIIKSLKNKELSCIVESVRSEHWKHVLLALSRDISLTKVHFASSVSPHEEEEEIIPPENIGLKLVPVPAGQVDCQAELCIGCCSSTVYKGFIPVVDIQAKMKKDAQYFPTPYGRTPKNINNITVALNNLLQKSQTLSILKLENLALTSEDAKELAEGLSKTTSLKYLSLSGCHFEEGAVSIICHSLNSSCVSWIDFSFCALNLPDIEAIAKVIKTHCIRRRNDMFQKILRSEYPCVVDMPGLTRISLNHNTLDEKALNVLIESLADDLWVKALDLQNCDIDDAGATALLDLATTNISFVVIDLRMNQIEDSLLSKIKKRLEQNRDGKDVKCSELPMWRPSELVRKYNSIGVNKMKTLKKTATHRFKISRKVTKSNSNVKKKSRLDEFFEFLSQEKPELKCTCVMSPKDKSLPTKEKNCLDGFKDASSQTSTEPHDLNELLRMVKSQTARLQNEMKIRKFLLTKFRQLNIENAQLRQMLKTQNDDIYIDQETFFDVKHTFEKLKVFFDVMKKYGLWEYISMLGFDESTDVVLLDNNSQKCMKVTRDASFTSTESPPAVYDKEVCCNCRKIEYRHKKLELHEDGHLCVAGTIPKSVHSKVPVKDDRMNDKVPQEVLHKVINSKSVSARKSDIADLPKNKKKQLNQPGQLCSEYLAELQKKNRKPLNQPGKICSENHTDSPKDKKKPLGKSATTPCSADGADIPKDKKKPSGQPNTPCSTAGAQMLIKKFSYSNMPKQLKELVSPTDFYKIVKKELERCENEAKKPYKVITSENYESSKSTAIGAVHFKKTTFKAYKCRNEGNVVPTAERRKSSTKQECKISDDEFDFDNIPISELVALEKEKRKYSLSKKDAKSPASSVSNSKVSKNVNQAKIKETKSLSKSEEVLSQSKQNFSTSQANCKGIQSKYNASSDEINSSDSVVTASDNVSSRSSVSSSSSNKSRGKLSDVTDASTFGEIESIADTEVVSETFQTIGTITEITRPSVDSRPVSSQSSTLKDALESKSNKSNKSAISGSSSTKDFSKKDNSVKTNTPPQGKSKNANKHNKNRPKSNSSKGSSIPSLSEITTVSSNSLKTYSVMKQISDSDGEAKEKK